MTERINTNDTNVHLPGDAVPAVLCPVPDRDWGRLLLAALLLLLAPSRASSASVCQGHQPNQTELVALPSLPGLAREAGGWWTRHREGAVPAGLSSATGEGNQQRGRVLQGHCSCTYLTCQLPRSPKPPSDVTLAILQW